MRKIVYVSLFDGISGGSQALRNLGIKPIRTYISEVDKFATKVQQSNFPNSIQLGDILQITNKTAQEIRDYADKEGALILMIEGSPCTDFSFIGKQKGMSTVGEEKIEITTLEQYLHLKDKGYTFTGSSYLFWEMIRIKQILKPEYFLGENTRMASRWRDAFDNALGFKAVHIDSKDVSPQSRKRNYWSNMPYTPPKYKNTLVTKDILESGLDWVEPNNYLKRNWNKVTRLSKVALYDVKNPTIVASMHKQNTHAYIKNYDGKVRLLTVTEVERLQGFPDGYTSIVSKTRAFYALGNSFNVPTIERFLVSLRGWNGALEKMQKAIREMRGD